MWAVFREVTFLSAGAAGAFRQALTVQLRVMASSRESLEISMELWEDITLSVCKKRTSLL